MSGCTAQPIRLHSRLSGRNQCWFQNANVSNSAGGHAGLEFVALPTRPAVAAADADAEIMDHPTNLLFITPENVLLVIMEDLEVLSVYTSPYRKVATARTNLVVG